MNSFGAVGDSCERRYFIARMVKGGESSVGAAGDGLGVDVSFDDGVAASAQSLQITGRCGQHAFLPEQIFVRARVYRRTRKHKSGSCDEEAPCKAILLRAEWSRRKGGL